jgi:hypothetical protein
MLVSFKRSRPPQNVRAHLRLEAPEERWNPANFDVTNLNNAGAGSLRAAIAAAEAAQGGDTITLAANLNGVIDLQTALDPITQNLEIKWAAGANGAVTVQRAGNAQANFRILDIAQGAIVNISKLTFAHGVSDGDGGGIRNLGKLTLTDCTVDNNDAPIRCPTGTTAGRSPSTQRTGTVS